MFLPLIYTHFCLIKFVIVLLGGTPFEVSLRLAQFLFNFSHDIVPPWRMTPSIIVLECTFRYRSIPTFVKNSLNEENISSIDSHFFLSATSFHSLKRLSVISFHTFQSVFHIIYFSSAPLEFGPEILVISIRTAK